MTQQEILQAIRSTEQVMAEHEHAELERHADASVVNELPAPALKPAALAFLQAAGDCCGVACDSDCACS